MFENEIFLKLNVNGLKKIYLIIKNFTFSHYSFSSILKLKIYFLMPPIIISYDKI